MKLQKLFFYYKIISELKYDKDDNSKGSKNKSEINRNVYNHFFNFFVKLKIQEMLL